MWMCPTKHHRYRTLHCPWQMHRSICEKLKARLKDSEAEISEGLDVLQLSTQRADSTFEFLRVLNQKSM